MAVSNLHQGVVAGAAQPTGVTFDPNLILNSIYLHGSGTSGDAMTRISRTPGNRNRWLFGTWYHPLRVPLASGDRITIFAAGASGAGFYLSHEEEGDIRLFHRDESGNEGAVVTAEFYRDATAWIHILVDYDSANANSGDRITMYVNGKKVGVNSGTRPAQNKSIMVNTEGEIERIGQDFSTTPDSHGAMYLAQTFLMDNKSIVNGDHATTDFLDTFTLGTNGSQIIPKSNDDIKTLVAAAGVNSFFLNYEDTTAKGSVAGVVRDRKATESTNHVLGITPTMSEGIQAGAVADVTTGFRKTVGVESNTTNLTLVFDLGSGNGQAVQSVSFTCEGTTSFSNDAGQGGGSQSNGRIKDLNISGSNNGTDYTTLSDAGDVAQQRSGSLYTLSWTNSTTYRYLKFANVGVHGGSRSNVGGIGFHTEQTPVIGNDFWGNGAVAAASSIVTANQKRHSPSLVYPVVNAVRPAISGKTFSEGNLKVSSTSGFGQGNVLTTFPLSTGGKWYWEVIDAAASANQTYGIAKADAEASANGLGNDAKSWAFYNNQYRHSGNVGAVPDSPTNTGTRYMFAVDVDAGKFWMGNDGTWWKPVGGSTAGDPAAGTNPAFTDTDIAEGDTFPAIDLWSSDSATFVFDEDDFAHTIPTGFNYLNSSNLTAPDYQGIDYFDATLYEGNGDNQRVGDFVPFTDTFAIGNSAMWYSEDIRRLRHTYSSEAAATSDNSSDSAVYRKATISFWVKFIETNDSDQQTFISAGNAAETERFQMYAHGTDDIVYILIDPSGSDNNRQFVFAKGLLSTQAWSNVVIHLDTNNSTAADRMKVWINGNAVTNTDTSRPYTAMTQGQNSFLFADEQIMIGHLTPSDTYNSVYNFNSYLAEYHVIDGYNKAVSDFGQVDTSTNRWVPKDYKTNVGTYGNRGFYLKFDGTPGAGSGSDMGKDSSGNNIHFTEETHGSGSAWAAGDKTTDTPSENFCTWDAGLRAGNSLSEGGLKATSDGNADWDSVLGTMFVSSGKFYWEIERDSDGGGSESFRTGVALQSFPLTTTLSGRSDVWTVSENGQKNGGGAELVNYGDSTTTGDFIGVALDMDRNAIYFSKNGTWMNSASASGIAAGTDYSKAAFSNVEGRVAPFLQSYSAQTATLRTNADNWEGTAPSGFLELNQDNLDATASKLTAWAWIKNRDATDNHILVDRVRGIGKDMHSNDTPGDVSSDNTVRRFLQRGVEIGSDAEVNTASESYVLWQWLVGASATTGSTTSPAGSIASTSIVADADHFSIISYTGNATSGATIGHGLSAAPEMIWIKERDNANGWIVGNGTVGYGNIVRLDTADALTSDSGAFNSTAPSATLITLGSNNGTNRSTGAMICYAFRSVPGVCKIGSYEGNGDADGPYIQTGFKPRWIIIKNIDVARDWTIADTARHPSNVVGEFLYASSSAVESARGVTSGTDYDLDILSDGFKIRTVDGALNSSTLIYMAMAEIGGNGTLPPIYGR